MSLILKVMHAADQSPVAGDNPHSVYGGITSVSFKRLSDGTGEALCYVREPVKTVLVPGFVEHERIVVFDADAYVMNEDGKTISTFAVPSSGRRGGRP